jgi:hypothetical protein
VTDINSLITFDISAAGLAATAGMLIQFGDKDLAEQVSQQVLVQLMAQDTDIDGVVAGDADPVVSFSVPVGIVMLIADALMDNADGPHAGSIVHLMKEWQPCMEKALADLRGHQHPFDEHGNCMN